MELKKQSNYPSSPEQCDKVITDAFKIDPFRLFDPKIEGPDDQNQWKQLLVDQKIKKKANIFQKVGKKT